LPSEGEYGLVAYALAMRHIEKETGSPVIQLSHYRLTGPSLFLAEDQHAQMVRTLLYWGGDDRGSDAWGERDFDFPHSVPIGSHAPIAAGVALALKHYRAHSAALCVFGDGATSEGATYEAMNIAAVMQLPVVFLIDNNQWAISVPVAKQTAAKTLAQKGIAAGIERCIQIDGNDVPAVYEATLSPLDMDTIRASVERTGRCVIVHEAAQTYGIGAEIGMRLWEAIPDALIAPVRRVTGWDISMPSFLYQGWHIPSEARIRAAALETLDHKLW
jgi:hypothetical protein